ncbi:MAG: PLP-dependent aminotransferase family protein [Clostridia bacterium]|nr:PLP-dependent aminotransferase family protein [Clostridia bacterium]
MRNSEVKEPAYLRLYKNIRDEIVKGVYPYGSKLPSKRTLSEEKGVSTVTVEHAYALLGEEGYIEPRERSGYFVIFRSDDGFMNSSDEERRDIHPAHKDTRDSVSFPFSVLAKTMRSVLSSYEEGILDRSDNQGSEVLREAISKYLARSRGIKADISQIVIGSGAEYLYSLIVEILGRDKVYAIEAPSYNKIEQVYIAENVPLVKLPLGKEGIKNKALSECTADILHISPYRSFPSGVTASASKRHQYLRWAEKSERILIEDDFESEFSPSRKTEETLFSRTKNNNVIYMNTFSKTLSPSLRVAYMILPEELSRLFREKLGFYSCTVPTYIQLVIAELINTGNFERHINRVRRSNRS